MNTLSIYWFVAGVPSVQPEMVRNGDPRLAESEDLKGGTEPEQHCQVPVVVLQ